MTHVSYSQYTIEEQHPKGHYSNWDFYDPINPPRVKVTCSHGKQFENKKLFILKVCSYEEGWKMDELPQCV